VLYLWFVKTFLAKKFIADVIWEAVFDSEEECTIVDLSGLKKYNVVSIVCHFKTHGPNIGPRIARNKKCYFWKGGLIWD
jgi:hypothetical protein